MAEVAQVGKAPDFGRIPAALKALRAALWGVDQPPTKRPYHPKGYALSVSKPGTWPTFEQCEAAYAKGSSLGVGVLLDGSGIVCVDIDNARVAFAELPSLAGLVISAVKAGAYCEVSQSGEGLHLFVRAKLPAAGLRKSFTAKAGATYGVEAYAADRFICTTGHGQGDVIAAQEFVDALVAVLGRQAGQATTPNLQPLRETTPAPVVSPEVIERVALAVQHKRPALWAGQWSDKASDLSAAEPFPSQSEADLSLARTIVRVARAGGVTLEMLPATADAVFRRSGLMREKWEREDYRARTLAAACADVEPGNTTTPAAHSTNDVRNGEEFASMWRGVLAYVPEHGQWLERSEDVWKPVGPERILQACKAVTTAIAGEGARLMATDADKARKLLAHAMKSQTLARLEAMARMGASEPGVAISAATLDADPYLLGVRNGVVDLRTGQLVTPPPGAIVTRQCNAAVVPGAQCAVWHKFLAEVFEGDAETVETVQRALGYTLLGCKGEEVLFVCVGRGANGKSVFSNVAMAIMGGYGKTAPGSLLTTRRADDTSARNDMAMLAGARMVSINELQSGDRLDERVVKQLAGREPIAARHLYHEFFEFTPQFAPWLRTNHRPIITGDDDGIWRRIVMLEFTRQFAEDERDPHLESRLLEERDGILAWMIEGARKYLCDGLRLSPAIRRASAAYRRDSDLLGEFLEEHYKADAQAREERGKVWEAWRQWCMQNGTQPGTKATLTRRLHERGYGGATSNGRRYFTGLARIHALHQPREAA